MFLLYVLSASNFTFLSGENPISLQGCHIGVFIGQMCHDSATLITEEDSSGFEAIGTSRAMVANRISNFFGFTGKKEKKPY